MSANLNSDSRTSPKGIRQPAVWVILAGMMVAMHVGKVSVAIPMLRESLGIDLVEAGVLLSISQLAGMFLAVFVGLFADAWGLRRSLLTGLILMGFSSLLGAWSDNITSLLLLRAIEGMAFLMVAVTAPALLRHLVAPDKLAKTMGFWGTFMPGGVASALFLGPWVLDIGGWTAWWQVLGVMSLLMSAVCAWVLWPVDMPPVMRSGGWREHAQRLQQTWRNPGTWWVALSFGLYSSQWLVVIGFLPTLLQAVGVSASVAGSATGVAAVVNVLGNVLGGQLLHRGWRIHHVLGGGFFIMAACAVVVFDAGGIWSPGVRVAASVVFSGLGGVIPGSLFTLAVRVAPSEQTVSTSLGWTTQMSMVGQFIMPPAAAALAQSAGTWQWTWILNVSACALAWVLIARLRRLLPN